jgi:hypothetical protein
MCWIDGLRRLFGFRGPELGRKEGLMRKSKKMHAIAMIERLADRGGFSWGSSRRHYLATARSERELRERVIEQLGIEDGGADLEGLVLMAYPVAQVVSWQGPEDELLTDWMPSAGAPCWETDIWLGLADYLSFRAFADQAGRSASTYDLPVEIAADIATTSRERTIEAVLRYLDAERDAVVWTTLHRALELAAASET